MKKITLLFLLFASTTWSYAQCTTTTGGAWPQNVVNALNDGSITTIATDNYPNAEFSGVNGLIIGNTYTVTATNTTSAYITIAETDNTYYLTGTVIAHGASSVTFTATTERVILFWHLDANCGTQASGDTLTTIQCTSASCVCTAAVPDVPVSPTPADYATNVAIDMTDPTAPEISFAWSDNGEATEYDFTLVGVGTIPVGGNPVTITYSWQYDTTYTWNVVGNKDCNGSSATSATFTFTTGSDPLSNESFENKGYMHFYNTNNSSLELTTANASFENIVIYNLLGQTVLEQKLSQTNENVNLSNVANGTYIAKVTLDGKTETFKFIKR